MKKLENGQNMKRKIKKIESIYKNKNWKSCGKGVIISKFKENMKKKKKSKLKMKELENNQVE